MATRLFGPLAVPGFLGFEMKYSFTCKFPFAPFVLWIRARDYLKGWNTWGRVKINLALNRILCDSPDIAGNKPSDEPTKNMMTPKQCAYLLTLINKATGKSYRFLSQVEEDGIGKESQKVKGISAARASALITEWQGKSIIRNAQ